MTRKEIIKRYILFIISLFFSGLGVAITKKGGLGVSPISSVPNVMSIKFTSLSLGNWLIIWNCMIILGQILILRKKFQLIQLLQIPLSFLFGYFTDLGTWLISFFEADIYALKLLLVFTGTFTLGFGIALSVIANVIMNSGEAFVKAIADTLKKDFGNVKICFDIFCVISALILSLLFFGRVEGAREGTVIAAFCTGLAVKLWVRLLKNKTEKILTA